jgi:hypothetical protein
LHAQIAEAKLVLQVDIGYGDAVTPAAQEIEYPSLLDMPAPRIKAYPPETVVAEKLQAAVVLGMPNSRMKDFFDLWAIGHFLLRWRGPGARDSRDLRAPRDGRFARQSDRPQPGLCKRCNEADPMDGLPSPIGNRAGADAVRRLAPRRPTVRGTAPRSGGTWRVVCSSLATRRPLAPT